MPLDRIADKVAALGVPGLVLVAVIAFTGVTGGAAIVVALATLGGPLGMMGGIGVLLLLGLISKALTEYGFEAFMNAVVGKLKEQGKSDEAIIAEIRSYWFISDKLKQRIIGALYMSGAPKP